MRSKFANVVILIAAVLAFLPTLGVNPFVDGYASQRMTMLMQRSANAISADIEANAEGALQSLQAVLDNSPSLCTPTFIGNVRQAMQVSPNLRNVVVENSAGLQYCNAFGGMAGYVPLSAPLSIPGHAETIALVRLAGLDTPMLKVSRPYGAERLVSAVVPLLSSREDALMLAAAPATGIEIVSGDGNPVETFGDAGLFDGRNQSDAIISVQSLAGEIPLRALVGLPLARARSDYAYLKVVLTGLTCAASAGLLLLMLYYVRRSTLPAFDLERAIALGELRPFYQPVIDLNTGRLLGCEVLCRWVRKSGQIVPPGAFIDYAEATNLAIPMTISLMQQVRTDLSELCRDMPGLKVSINLFEGHFRDDSIVEDVRAIFGSSPIGFRQLTFEITERRPLGNSRQAHSVIAGLHALGARLALDDVGTGHSNLAYLQTLGVDVIKIDHVFVDMVKADTTQMPVLDGLIAMARDLGTEVVAEGVETVPQALYLRQRGVVQAQGFLFAPALSPKAFKELAQALNGVNAPLSLAA